MSKRFMFVYEDVLCEYTQGMAMIVADSLAEAKKFAIAEFGEEKSLFRANDNWDSPAGCYELKVPYPARGVKHYVYGGS